MTTWSDTPPTEAGDYWVKRRSDGEEQIGTKDGANWYFKWPYEDWFPADNPDDYQFGHRIPTNDELSQIDRERHALCEVATLCMNTRAIMPEFREIGDYTEVVDILGAFLERLIALPGLIEEYATACRLHELAELNDEQSRFTAGFRQPTIGHATAQARSERCRDLLDKINAILGVPNDARAS